MPKQNKISKYFAQECLKNSLLLLMSLKMLENSKNNHHLKEKSEKF